MTVHSSIVHVTVHIPEGRQSVAAVEDRFRAASPTIPLSRGVLQRMYGLAERTVAPDHEQPSDLAVRAAQRLLADTDTDPADFDLLLYAGILADMEEPATAHVVADKLGLGCPVLDLKNACNGVLNALEVADAFIRGGRYRRVLVTTAEVSTRESRWEVDDPAEVLTALPSLSTGDMGSALLVAASDRPGILGTRFFANSWGWRAATLPNPYAQHRTLGRLRIDSAQLVDSFEDCPPRCAGRWRSSGSRAPISTSSACTSPRCRSPGSSAHGWEWTPAGSSPPSPPTATWRPTPSRSSWPPHWRAAACDAAIWWACSASRAGPAREWSSADGETTAPRHTARVRAHRVHRCAP